MGQLLTIMDDQGPTFLQNWALTAKKAFCDICKFQPN